MYLYFILFRKLFLNAIEKPEFIPEFITELHEQHIMVIKKYIYKDGSSKLRYNVLSFLPFSRDFPALSIPYSVKHL